MLRRALVTLMTALVMPLAGVLPDAAAGGDAACPPGTSPVSVGLGVVCLTVTDPGEAGQYGDPGTPGDAGGESSHVPAGCFKSDGSEVPCQTDDGSWWPANQCYAKPYDAPLGTPAWQGHTDGSLWQCTSCASPGNTTACSVKILWTAAGQEPGPPSPEQLAATALGMLALARAEVHTAPPPNAVTYVGVENWLWVPESQWAILSKSVSAGATAVTVTPAPAQLVWKVGAQAVTCYGPGKAWQPGMTDAATTTCGYTFAHTSSSQPSGRFAVTATIRYHVTWTCAGTCPTTGADLGLLDAPTGASTMRVLQRQTVVVR